MWGVKGFHVAFRVEGLGILVGKNPSVGTKLYRVGRLELVTWSFELKVSVKYVQV